MDLNQQNQIEAYLSGQMTPEEHSNFESLLEVNPELQQQLRFQSEVINGIGSYRKSQLKARLEAIDPTPAWWTIAQLSPVGQFIGGAVIVGAIGLGTYFIANSSSDSITTEPIFVTAPIEDMIEFDIPEIPAAFIEPREETELLPSLMPEEKENSSSLLLQPGQQAKKEIFAPLVSVPNAGLVESDKEFQPNDLPTPEETSVAEVENSDPIDVEIISSRASKVKYQYYSGKLFLYGKFQEEPYQILEINSATGRKVYLFHMDVFYHIVPVDKPSSLKKVEDRDLIKELSILRKSK